MSKHTPSRVLVIHLAESDCDDERIVERVCELVKQGYTSGNEPGWRITTDLDADRQELLDDVTAALAALNAAIAKHGGAP